MGGLSRAQTWSLFQNVSTFRLVCLVFAMTDVIFLLSTELECSVKGYPNAVFRSCSSATEANIKFHLFTERIVQMFDGPDPFSGVDALTLKEEEVNYQQPAAPDIQSSPTLAFPKLSLTPQVTESWNTPLDDVAGPSKLASNRDGARSSCSFDVPRRANGWYVAYHAVLPGVYSSL